MKEAIEKNKKSILYWCISAVVFALILAGIIAYRQAVMPKKQAVDIVTMGDSLLGQVQDETSVTASLSEMTGKTVLNGCLGGTTMSYVDLSRDGNNTYEMYSMVSFAKAIAAKDFGAQQTKRFLHHATEYFEDSIYRISTVDFEKNPVLFICHGLNDFHSRVPLDNAKDSYDEYSYAGAIRSIVRTLKKNYPGLRIIFMTPTYSWYPNTGLTCENMWTEGPVLEDYVDTLLKTCKELNVESIDLYHDFYDHNSFEDWSVYTWDGNHPNEAGREKIARAMADYLKENP